MTTAVIGATGRVGSEIVRGVLSRGDAVTALVVTPARPAASSANPASTTTARNSSDARASSTRADASEIMPTAPGVSCTELNGASRALSRR